MLAFAQGEHLNTLRGPPDQQALREKQGPRDKYIETRSPLALSLSLSLSLSLPRMWRMFVLDSLTWYMHTAYGRWAGERRMWRMFMYALLWSRSCHTHHAARAKECICRLMHCAAFTSGQPDRSCAHVFKRANKHAKGHACDKVWDV